MRGVAAPVRAGPRDAGRVAIPVLLTMLVAGLLIGAVPPLGPATAAAQDRTPEVAGPLRLDLADVGPRVVTATGPTTLTVTGTLTNTGDAPVEELVARVQRGDPLTTEGRLRDALDGSAATDSVTPQFEPVADVLAPGEQIAIRLDVPLQGAPDSSLALAGTGVYELLVNVNGVPLDGARARLAAVRLLLPVLGLPEPDSAPEPSDPDGSGIPFALLYPITDAPRRLSTVPVVPPVLADDALAASLAPGGRLDGLVAALAEQAPAGSAVGAATCVAVDPELLETVAAMREGYLFLGPDGVPVPGAGADAAGQWLDRLAATTRGSCVVALPQADADLVALTRGGLGDAAMAAVLDGREIVADLLQTPVVPGVTWPADGVLDEPTLETTDRAGGRALVLAADGLGQGRSRPTRGVVPIANGETAQFAVLADPLLTLAATGPGGTQPVTGTGGAVVASTPAGTSTPLSTQDAIGTLAFRAAAGTSAPDRAPLLLAPPHQWAAEGVGAAALLGAADDMIDAGLLVPRGLDGAVAQGAAPDAEPRPITYPLDAGGQEIPAGAIATIADAAADLTDLASAVVGDSGVGVPAEDVLGPLSRGLVRPASAAWRGSPDLATRAAEAGLDQIGRIRATIRVLEPPSPYSLGSSEAPLPLTVANDLPVTVRVRIEVSSTSGLRVAPIQEVQVPPQGRRQVSANVQVTRSGRFSVDASVRTPDGGLLGPPSRLQVRSTAYGTITVWLTAGGGALLVVLVVRRVVRRIRGESTSPAAGPTGPLPATGPVRAAPPGGGRPTPTGTALVPIPEDLAPVPRPVPPGPAPPSQARPRPVPPGPAPPSQARPRPVPPGPARPPQAPQRPAPPPQAPPPPDRPPPVPVHRPPAYRPPAQGPGTDRGRPPRPDPPRTASPRP